MVLPKKTRKSTGRSTCQEIANKNNYTDFVIVAEGEWYAGREVKKICLYNTVWEVIELGFITRVDCKKLLPEIDTCRAEVLFVSDHNVEWKVRKEFKVGDFAEQDLDIDIGLAIRKLFTAGDFVECDLLNNESAVIRILEDKQKILKEFDDRSAADVTFMVNGEACKGDRKNLAVVSPVFNKMLYGQFAEAQQDVIPLEGIESADIFKDFLLAVSPLRVQPNPSNVVALLKLAHQYDIPFLLRNCEDHLMHCYEIPIADRLLLAGKYGLDCLKVRITQQLSMDELKEIFKEKYQQLRELGADFILYLTSFLTD